MASFKNTTLGIRELQSICRYLEITLNVVNKC